MPSRPILVRRRVPLWPALSPLLAPLLATMAQPAAAEETTTLDAVTVTADAAEEPAVSGSTGTAGEFSVGSAGIARWGGPGGGSPYRAVSGMPSVNSQSADAYGLSNLPGGTKGMRVRGELATHGSMGSVDGIPLGTVNPGPGYLWLFDAENLAGVTLHQGPIAPDQTNLFTTQGALDSRLRWPTATTGLQLSQSFGSEDFTRSRARWDTGTLAGGGALFFSASHTAADNGVPHPAGRHRAEGRLPAAIERAARPPTAWKMYTPTAAGDLSGGATWAILAEVTERPRRGPWQRRWSSPSEGNGHDA